MQSIGERLEEARKRKGISIREAAEATKIRSDYLHKFESNQYDIRLPEIYVRGFLRSYSNFLKLPSDKIIADYNSLGLTEAKTSRTVNREVYGRMDISSTAKDAKASKDGAPTGSTNPPMPATAGAGTQPPVETHRNPATFVPPHSASGSPIDKKLIIKFGAIALAVVLIIVLVIMLLTGGHSSNGSSTAQTTPRETWVQPQANEPVMTLIAKNGAVTVTVKTAPVETGTIIYQGTIPSGETRTIPRRGKLNVETAQPINLQFGINNQVYPMPEGGKADIAAP